MFVLFALSALGAFGSWKFSAENGKRDSRARFAFDSPNLESRKTEITAHHRFVAFLLGSAVESVWRYNVVVSTTMMVFSRQVIIASAFFFYLSCLFAPSAAALVVMSDAAGPVALNIKFVLRPSCSKSNFVSALQTRPGGDPDHGTGGAAVCDRAGRQQRSSDSSARAVRERSGSGASSANTAFCRV